MPANKSFLNNSLKDHLISVFVLILLIGAVIAGVVLVQREQDIRNKASQEAVSYYLQGNTLVIEYDNFQDAVLDVNVHYQDGSSQNFHEQYSSPIGTKTVNLSLKDVCVKWIQVHGTNYHYTSDCSQLSSPSPSPSPSATPEPSPSASPSPSPSTSPTPTPTEVPNVYGCPLTPEGNQILVDFGTVRLLANRGPQESQFGPFSVGIPPGNYKITLASSDAHTPQDETQPKEQYFVEFFSQSSLLSVTNPIDDIPDSETNVVQVVNQNLSLTQSVNEVYVKHAAIGDSNVNSVNAECMLLEPQKVAITAQCLNVGFYDSQWQAIIPAQYPTLLPGDVVRFTVGGSTTKGNFSKARFIINGETQPETNLTRPGTDEYYFEYEIPEGFNQLNVKPELYHSVLGWI